MANVKKIRSSSNGTRCSFFIKENQRIKLRGEFLFNDSLGMVYVFSKIETSFFQYVNVVAHWIAFHLFCILWEEPKNAQRSDSPLAHVGCQGQHQQIPLLWHRMSSSKCYINHQHREPQGGQLMLPAPWAACCCRGVAGEARQPPATRRLANLHALALHHPLKPSLGVPSLVNFGGPCKQRVAILPKQHLKQNRLFVSYVRPSYPLSVPLRKSFFGRPKAIRQKF